MKTALLAVAMVAFLAFLSFTLASAAAARPPEAFEPAFPLGSQAAELLRAEPGGIVVDRILPHVAVLVLDGGSFVVVPRRALRDGLVEGDVVDSELRPRPDETARRRSRVASKRTLLASW